MAHPPAKDRCVARGVTKAYGNNPILRGIDLQIPEGSFAVLVGPSGCGKSTLLRAVAGLETVDGGTITLGDRDVTALPPRDRDVAMVFQSYALYPHLTVRDNLAFGLELRKTPKDIIAARVAEASTMLGLDPLLERLPKQLSGGQRQRVAMGRAVVRRAQLYLFDEPLSNLDAALRAEVRVEIRKLHERIGATTLYVTHDQVEAMTLADTLWVLHGGKVAQSGPPLDVYERPNSLFVAGFLGSPKINLLPGTLAFQGNRWSANERASEPGNYQFRVDEDRFAAGLQEGRSVTIGVRPQDVAVAHGDDPVFGQLTVDLVEALGSEGLAHGDLGGTPFVARLDAEEARTVKPKSRVPLTVKAHRVHLFDPSTEKAL